MLRNYLTVAVRNLMRHKGYSAINIVGLSVGMACCALIALYVQYELSYDTFHSKAGRIYRVLMETRGDDGSVIFCSGVDGPFAPALMKDFPEVEDAVRLMAILDLWTKYADRVYHHGTHTVFAADPSFLKVFDFPLVKGDRETALDNPFSLVITEEVARCYFADENPIGKVITFETRMCPGDFTVTGVIRAPENSSFKFDLVFSTRTPLLDPWPRGQMENWQPFNAVRLWRAFVVLREGVDAGALEARLPEFMERYMGREVREKNTYHLQLFSRLHLYTGVDCQARLDREEVPMFYGDIDTVYLFSAIACLILLIACVNFMNLSTARSMSRAKEVGLRKVSGAYRFQLIRQFLGEAVLLSCLAFVLALGLVELALPGFSSITGRNLSLYGNRYHLLALPGFVGLVGLLAGSYPAFFLSAFEPVVVLKGRLRTSLQGVLLRKGLVVFQFAMSILLMIGTATAYRQFHYMQHQKVGYNKENLIQMPIFHFDRWRKTDSNTSLVRRYQAVKQAFLAHPGVLSATAYAMPMGAYGSAWQRLEWGGAPRIAKLEGNKTYSILHQCADEDFITTFGIDLIAGRNFSESVWGGGGREPELLINEAVVKQFGWEDPIGKKIQIQGGAWGGTVVGVVKDFHSQSLHQPIKPLIIQSIRGFLSLLSVRIRKENLPETLAFLKQTWKQFLPDQPFEYAFMDESLNLLYREDQRVGQLMGAFALLAIAIACLGLFGLSAFSAEQRTKEIGVRKVLGASVGSIVALLSKDFVKLVLVANLIVWPVAYYAMRRWLQDFAYRVELGPGVFILGGVLALVIALLTVSAQAIRAARANPVEALRYE